MECQVIVRLRLCTLKHKYRFVTFGQAGVAGTETCSMHRQRYCYWTWCTQRAYHSSPVFPSASLICFSLVLVEDYYLVRGKDEEADHERDDH